MTGDDARLGEVARRAAEAGARYARRAFRRPLTVEYKRDAMDAVTAVDREAQRRVLEVVLAETPDAAVVAEEGNADEAVPEAELAWVVDPIDGTNNFVRGNRMWCTAVGLLRDREPVLAATALPALGDTYAATRTGTTRNGRPVEVSERDALEGFTAAPIFGLELDDREPYLRVSRVITEALGDLRRHGSAQAALGMVASGELEAAIATSRLSPWDTVAGVHLVREAGGRVTDLAGGDWHVDSRSLVASNGRRHEAVLAALRDGLATVEAD